MFGLAVLRTGELRLIRPTGHSQATPFRDCPDHRAEVLILSQPVRLRSEMMSLWRVASAWGRAPHCVDPHGKIMKEILGAELLPLLPTKALTSL